MRRLQGARRAPGTAASGLKSGCRNHAGDLLSELTGAEAANAYQGRFAPTPSGPLHLGSLLCAAASWLDARAHAGRWSVRIDDLDTPRVMPGAEARILASLEAHCLTWDGPVVRQSEHREQYRAAFEVLAEGCYACRCTRRELSGATAYRGTCRDLGLPMQGNAVRIRVAEGRLAFTDRVQGHHAASLAATGDFVVRRRDGIASYPLAVVVDDAAMGVNEVVRGADLFDMTPRQLYLQRLLGKPTPRYGHVPVVVEGTGVKLSKHNAATAISDRLAEQNIASVLQLLGLDAPLGRVEDMLAWGFRHWDIANIPATPSIGGFAAIA